MSETQEPLTNPSQKELHPPKNASQSEFVAGGFARTVTRPIISIIFTAVIAQAVTQGIALPEWFIALASAAILSWFGERTVNRIRGKNV